jgi:phospholipase C
VPCIIVSPWTAGGRVCGEKFDHTSVLRFLEKFTGVREPNISDWRRKTFGDLTSAFRFEAASRPPSLRDTHGELTLSRHDSRRLAIQEIGGSPKQALPLQEKGTRQRIPP